MSVDIEIKGNALKDHSPQLTSLENYAELTEDYNLVRDIVVERDEDDELMITIHLTYIGKPYRYSGEKAVAGACSLLHLISLTAESQQG